MDKDEKKTKNEEKKANGGWDNLNGISDDKKVCDINNMNCLEEGDESTPSITDMNAADEKKDMACSLNDMNCLGEDKK